MALGKKWLMSQGESLTALRRRRNLAAPTATAAPDAKPGKPGGQARPHQGCSLPAISPPASRCVDGALASRLPCVAPCPNTARISASIAARADLATVPIIGGQGQADRTPMNCQEQGYSGPVQAFISWEQVVSPTAQRATKLGRPMGQLIRTEKHRRGFFGHVFKWLFIFNVVMLFWLVAGFMAASNRTATLTSEAERAGAAIGTAMGVGAILFIWIVGTVILGLFVLLTKGNKIVVEETRA